MTTIAVPTLWQTVRARAADPALRTMLDPAAPERTWLRLPSPFEVELWLISWPAGASTDWHDHGPSAGAFTVLEGRLVEHTFRGGLQLVDHGPDEGRSFPAGYAHNVRNESDQPALSLHAYSPRLTTMTRFQFLGDRLEVLGVEAAGQEW